MLNSIVTLFFAAKTEY